MRLFESLPDKDKMNLERVQKMHLEVFWRKNTKKIWQYKKPYMEEERTY